jgi:hypothetical protein
VEEEILGILRGRMEDCFFYEKGTGMSGWADPREGPIFDMSEGSKFICKGIKDTYDRFVRYLPIFLVLYWYIFG